MAYDVSCLKTDRPSSNRMRALLPRLTCLSILHSNLKSTNQLPQIHAQLIINGFKSPSFYVRLIELYCASYSLRSTTLARLVLHHHAYPNLSLFNTLIRCAPPEVSIAVFSNWVSLGNVVFDESTYIFLLGAGARSPSLTTLLFGKQVHALVLKSGMISSITVQTTCIHFYASNKDIEMARKLFDEMCERNTISWNAMLSGYCSQREKGEENTIKAMVLFKKMLVDASGAKPTDTTMVCVLSLLSRLGILEIGVCIHGYIEKTIGVPEDDVFLGTGLVDMYSKCGCLDTALTIFNRMGRRNVLTWTAMATGLALHGKGKETLELLDAMWSSSVKPNAVTFTSLLSACCHAGFVEEGLHLFNEMERKFGVRPQMQHFGCIVDLLGRSGRLEDAFEFIKAMPIQPDTILCRSLLSACHVHGNVLMCEKVGKLLLSEKPWHGCLDLSEDYLALSNFYAAVGRWEEVEIVREEMKAKGIENQAGYSSILAINR